jgi:hypothetical protein
MRVAYTGIPGAGLATGSGLEDGRVAVQVSSPRVQTGSGAHGASYPVVTGVSFSGGKAPGA